MIVSTKLYQLARISIITVIHQHNMANRYSNLQQGFTDTRGLEEYIRRNPKSFLEMLDSNPEFRLNVQQIARNWDDATIFRVAHLFEPNDYREPLSDRKMLVTPFAKMMSGYFSSAVAEMQYNPHFRMQPFSTYQNENKDVLKRFEEEYEEDKAKKQKAEKRMWEGVTKNNVETLKYAIEDTLKRVSAERQLQQVLTLLLLGDEKFRREANEVFGNMERNADENVDSELLEMRYAAIRRMPPELQKQFNDLIPKLRHEYEPLFQGHNLSEEQKQSFAIQGAALEIAYKSREGRELIDKQLQQILSPEKYQQFKNDMSQKPPRNFDASLFRVAGADKIMQLLTQSAHNGIELKEYRNNPIGAQYAIVLSPDLELSRRALAHESQLTGMPLSNEQMVNTTALDISAGQQKAQEQNVGQQNNIHRPTMI